MVEQIADLAYEPVANAGEFFDEHGNLKAIWMWTAAQKRMIREIEVIKRNIFPDDGKTDLIHKIKFWDIRTSKIKAIEIGMRHLGLLLPDGSGNDRPSTLIFPPGTTIDVQGTCPPRSMRIETPKEVEP